MTDLNRKRILIVDDTDSIHNDFQKILKTDLDDEFEKEKLAIFADNEPTDNVETPSYLIDHASQGKEAVELVKSARANKNPYSLAFVDIQMPPGFDGVETIKKIWEVDHDIQIVICTAYSDYSFANFLTALKKTDSFLILKKPFDPIEVLQLAAALTKKWELNSILLSQLDHLDEKIQEYMNKNKQ